MIPASLKAFIRLGKDRKIYKERIASIKENDVLLIGTAIHTNLGDHLIALAECDWLKKLSEGNVVELPREAYHLYKNKLSGIKNDIYITGGGWMGDLWPIEEKDIQNMVKQFHLNKVTILPQTIYYEDIGSPLIERGNKIFKTCDDLTLYVRDRNSFDFAKKYLAVKNVILSPDIGLLYKYDSHKECDASVVGICLREDREIERNEELIKQLITLLPELGITTRTVSTMSAYRVPESKRKEEVDKAIDSFADCGLLIVDRLHAMIFSYLAGRPCIAFDNKTKKVSGVYNAWLSDCPYILMINENTDMSEIKEFTEKNIGRSFVPKKFTIERII